MPAGTVIGIGQIHRSLLASKLLVGSGRQFELPILDVLTKIDGHTGRSSTVATGYKIQECMAVPITTLSLEIEFRWRCF